MTTRKWAALAVLGAVICCVIAFRHRLRADFIPLDGSRVGPNLIASLIQWAALFTAAVLLWPPWRARLHRLIDSKLAPLHARVEALHARHDSHAEHLDALGRSLSDLHSKLDALTDKESNPCPP
jgi:hypothetical protein